jgi:putative membrane protein
MNRMKMLAALVLGAWCSLAVVSLAADDKKESKEDSDKEFVTKAGASGLAEVNLGSLASVRAQDPAIRQFAQRMVADHRRANEELIVLANRHQITLPRTMDEKHQKKFEELGKLNGSDFDHAYMDCMLKGHEEAVDLFEKESKDGKNEALKTWAGNTLPIFKNHLDMARKMTKSEKKPEK